MDDVNEKDAIDIIDNTTGRQATNKPPQSKSSDVHIYIAHCSRIQSVQHQLVLLITILNQSYNSSNQNRQRSNEMKTASTIILLPLFFTSCAAFAPPPSPLKNNNRPILLQAKAAKDDVNNDQGQESRRQILQKSIPMLALMTTTVTAIASNPAPSHAISGALDQTNSAPDFVQKYEDFTNTAEGWQFKDAKIGTGDVSLEVGDRAVFAWSGYTIGYFGRPFEAKGGPVGGTLRYV